MKLGELLMDAQARLGDVSDSPRLDAELLMAHCTEWSRGQLFMRLRDPVDPAVQAEFEALLARRMRGIPIAYLLGERGFWTFDLAVTPDVLVPRPETELLVEWALQLLEARRAPRVADLGTGSGAIALALASERPDAQIDATDLSVAALEVARGNAERLGLKQLRFAQGHWFEALSGRYDLIASNPPYIAHADPHLEGLRHEPLMALTDGADGLNALREIIAAAPAWLVPGGWLLVEHGYDQGEAVRQLFGQAGFSEVSTRRDYGGQERCSAGRWEQT